MVIITEKIGEMMTEKNNTIQISAGNLGKITKCSRCFFISHKNASLSNDKNVPGMCQDFIESVVISGNNGPSSLRFDVTGDNGEGAAINLLIQCMWNNWMVQGCYNLPL